MSVQRVFLLHALAPLHVGVDEGLGAIDLPTMREVHTGYPIIPGSSVKGVLREEAEVRLTNRRDVEAAFGPPQSRSSDFRGGVVFTDAQLLCLPVRTLRGTFAWVTCVHTLGRLRRDLALGGIEAPSLPPSPAIDQGWVVEESPLLDPSGAAGGSVFLEDLLIGAASRPEVGGLAGWLADALWPDDGHDEERLFFRGRFLVVHDDVFSFLARSAMEVRARVQLDPETGTVKVGPWSEEHIPAEAVLHGLVMGRKTTLVVRKESDDPEPSETESWGGDRSLAVIAGLIGGAPVLRFGGHSGVGLGRARVRLLASDRRAVEAA